MADSLVKLKVTETAFLEANQKSSRPKHVGMFKSGDCWPNKRVSGIARSVTSLTSLKFTLGG